MKYLVVSDNHGDQLILEQLLQRFNNEVDYFIHCGDSELDSQNRLFQTFTGVKGNCDFVSDLANEALITTPADKIFIAHGHLFDINFTTDLLVKQAIAVDASITVFGHTHQLACEKIDGCLFVNPGSISQPRGSYQIPTFVIIESNDNEHIVQYYNRSLLPIEDLKYIFRRDEKL